MCERGAAARGTGGARSPDVFARTGAGKSIDRANHRQPRLLNSYSSPEDVARRKRGDGGGVGGGGCRMCRMCRMWMWEATPGEETRGDEWGGISVT